MIKDKPLHIVSVYQTGTSNDTKTDVDNIKRHYSMMEELKNKGVPFKELYGKYKGKPERSLVFEGDNHKKMVDKIAHTYNQESTLSIHPNGDTHVDYGHSKDHIGTWTQIDQHEIDSVDGYSYDPSTKTYWTAK